MNIPEPTFCFNCRNIRRMSWRNDRVFYKRKCSYTGEVFISLYPKNTEFPVYHPDIWYSDKWDPIKFGQEFDFSRPFFDQFSDLIKKVPRLGIDIVNCENSYYCNYCGDDKNCYLDIAGEGNEDCYYNLFTKHSKDCADCTFVYNSELCYESLNCYNCHSVIYSMYLDNCSDCKFCFDLKGCKNCLFSSNLRQKEYYIYNKPYSKEDYFVEIEKLNQGSFDTVQKNIVKWKDMMKKAVHRDMYNINTENSIGNNIKDSKNCFYCFNVTNSEDCRYMYDVLDAKDCYDLNYSLYKPECSYELISTLAMRYSAFCMASHYCGNSYYLDQCNNSNNLFGCIGLNQKKYCILNKQYTKKEYEKLISQIIEHMRSDGGGSAMNHSLHSGSWGEFFPSELSPFKYEETVANEYFPDGKIQITNDKIQTSSKIQDSKIPNEIQNINEDILNEILTCEISGKPFKIVAQELKFYQKMGLPIPRICPDERHKNRTSMRNPRALWKRKCAKTNQDIWTSYSPNREEKVVSEEAYKKIIY